MKSSDWIKKAEQELNARRDHVYWLKDKGLEHQRMRQSIFVAEDAMRLLGFTVKSNGVDGYEIKCKWSDAPEGLKK